MYNCDILKAVYLRKGLYDWKCKINSHFKGLLSQTRSVVTRDRGCNEESWSKIHVLIQQDWWRQVKVFILQQICHTDGCEGNCVLLSVPYTVYAIIRNPLKGYCFMVLAHCPLPSPIKISWRISNITNWGRSCTLLLIRLLHSCAIPPQRWKLQDSSLKFKHLFSYCDWQ